MQVFVVAAREGSQRELHTVEAETAEHAIEQIAAQLPELEQAGTYEAWPQQDPHTILRMDFRRRRHPSG